MSLIPFLSHSTAAYPISSAFKRCVRHEDFPPRPPLPLGAKQEPCSPHTSHNLGFREPSKHRPIISLCLCHSFTRHSWVSFPRSIEFCPDDMSSERPALSTLCNSLSLCILSSSTEHFMTLVHIFSCACLWSVFPRQGTLQEGGDVTCLWSWDSSAKENAQEIPVGE